MYPQSYVYAAAELKRTLKLLQESKDAEALVRLSELARLLLHHELITAAMTETPDSIVSLSQNDFQRRASTWIANQVRADVKEVIKAAVEYAEKYGDTLGHLNGSTVVWLGHRTPVGQALAWLRDEHDWSSFSGHEYQLITSTLLQQLYARLPEPEPKGLAGRDVIANAINDLAAKLEPLVAQMITLQNTYRLSDRSDTVERLRTFMTAMDGLRKGDVVAALDLLPTQQGLEEMRTSLTRIVDGVHARLMLKPIESHTLVRIRTAFQRWERAALVAAFQYVPHENTIQDAVDRAIYAEGLFPITHASVDQGQLDTLAIDSRLNEALRTRQPALLIEIKQLLTKPSKKGTRVKSPVTPASLRNAIKKAKGQAKRYQAHVLANPDWSDATVHVMVFYDGAEVYELSPADPEVTLVFLGKAVSSKGTAPLAIEP